MITDTISSTLEKHFQCTVCYDNLVQEESKSFHQTQCCHQLICLTCLNQIQQIHAEEASLSLAICPYCRQKKLQTHEIFKFSKILTGFQEDLNVKIVEKLGLVNLQIEAKNKIKTEQEILDEKMAKFEELAAVKNDELVTDLLDELREVRSLLEVEKLKLEEANLKIQRQADENEGLRNLNNDHIDRIFNLRVDNQNLKNEMQKYL